MSAPAGKGQAGANAQPHAIVLIVDDEVFFTRFVKDLLERSLSVRVIEAASGEAGLAALANERVDLIITDQSMPRMSGIEFLGEADRAAPDVPRAMLTSENDLALAVHALNDLRISAFFPKPLDTPRFIQTVREILSKRAAAKIREAGLKQANRVFQHEATMRGEKTRAQPFLGSLVPDRAPRDEEERR